MITRETIKNLLSKMHLLDLATSLKRKCFPIPVDDSFRPCTPNLLVAVTRALMHIKSSGMPEGDYLEFGIFRGFTLWYAQQMSELLGLSQMRFFGFDSFEGLPAQFETIDVSEEFRPKQYAAGRVYVERMFAQYKADMSKVNLVEGYFERSLTANLRVQKQMTACSLVVIDCDLYSSTVEALNFLSPMIRTGTIILFDDWNSFERDDNRGERRAFREFLERHPHITSKPFTEIGNHGAGFILSCK